MLKLMKSKLEVTSQPGVGSTFSFKIKTKYKNEIEEPSSAYNIILKDENDKINCAVPRPVQNDIIDRIEDDSTINNALPSTMHNIKSKRSSSLFNSEKFGTLKVTTKKSTLNTISKNF